MDREKSLKEERVQQAESSSRPRSDARERRESRRSTIENSRYQGERLSCLRPIPRMDMVVTHQHGKVVDHIRRERAASAREGRFDCRVITHDSNTREDLAFIKANDRGEASKN